MKPNYVIQRTNLVSHNHEPAITEAGGVRIVFIVLETHNLLNILNLFVLHDLVVFRFSNIEKFTAQGEYAEIVSADNTKASYCQGFG